MQTAEPETQEAEPETREAEPETQEAEPETWEAEPAEGNEESEESIFKAVLANEAEPASETEIASAAEQSSATDTESTAEPAGVTEMASTAEPADAEEPADAKELQGGSESELSEDLTKPATLMAGRTGTGRALEAACIFPRQDTMWPTIWKHVSRKFSQQPSRSGRMNRSENGTSGRFCSRSLRSYSQ